MICHDLTMSILKRVCSIVCMYPNTHVEALCGHAYTHLYKYLEILHTYFERLEAYYPSYPFKYT